MSQTSVAEQGKGFPGQRVDAGFNDVLSVIAEGAVIDGRMVSRGTDPDSQGLIPAAATDITNADNVLGVSLRDQSRESSSSGDPQHEDKAVMPVLRKGRVWVYVEDAVTPDSDVFVRFQGGDEGMFRSDADGGDAAQLAGARFMSSAGAGELAQLELNL